MIDSSKDNLGLMNQRLNLKRRIRAMGYEAYMPFEYDTHQTWTDELLKQWKYLAKLRPKRARLVIEADFEDS